MSTRTPERRRVELTFEDACVALETALDGPTRRTILEATDRTRGFNGALVRLRGAMQSHTFPTAAAALALDRVVRHLDTRTRAEGFHVLQAWDYRAHRFVDHIVPVLMLDRFANTLSRPIDENDALATLLDHYFLWILALLAVRAWDEGDANANLDRVTRLAGLLNGPNGSGHAFAEDGELLLLLAISQYHPKEPAYDLLLDRVRSLDDAHRRRAALVVAPTFGSHLRWGFRFMYRRDSTRMRDDNIVDYPWLLFAVETLVDAYDRMRDHPETGAQRDVVTEGLINALSADPQFFLDEAPDVLRAHEASHTHAHEQLIAHRLDLVGELERHRPDPARYSPLGFEANFLNNAVVAMVETVAGVAEPHPSLSDLFTSCPTDATRPSPLAFARRLTRFAGVTAGMVGGHALVVYDHFDGLARFDAALDVLRGTR
jgi:hypothetical protein